MFHPGCPLISVGSMAMMFTPITTVIETEDEPPPISHNKNILKVASSLSPNKNNKKKSPPKIKKKIEKNKETN